MGPDRESVPADKLEPVSGKRIGLPTASMKNRPTVSLPAFSAVIGREELRHWGATPQTLTLAAHTFQPVTKCTNVRLICGLRGAFLGFRNAFANLRLKKLWGFGSSFIPETGSAN